MNFISTFKTGTEVDVNNNYSNHSWELYTNFSRPFILDFITGQMDEVLYLSRHNKDIVIDPQHLYEETETDTLIIHHPDPALARVFQRPYILAAGQVQIHYCTISKPPFYSLGVLYDILNEMGSSLIRSGNDLILPNGDKAAGALNLNFGDKTLEVIALNFDINKDLEQYIPIEARHRPFGNIDVDINSLIKEFVDKMTDIKE